MTKRLKTVQQGKEQNEKKKWWGFKDYTDPVMEKKIIIYICHDHSSSFQYTYTSEMNLMHFDEILNAAWDESDAFWWNLEHCTVTGSVYVS